MSFRNLKAEMTKRGVTQAVAADCLGMTSKNFSLKVCESVPFTVEEIKKVREVFFPDLTIDYLVESDSD